LDVQLAALKVLKCITVNMLKLENKQVEKCDTESEKLPSTSYQKRLPTLFRRILDEDITDSCALSPKLLVMDAFISQLHHFEVLERVSYCSCISPYLDHILPQLFDLLPSVDLGKLFNKT
uniref:HEAT repeat-containing protein 1 n=1 Tax=Gongylonema pulchrum TaxID=637853 RepID=A0A183DHZ6_9BILA